MRRDSLEYSLVSFLLDCFFSYFALNLSVKFIALVSRQENLSYSDLLYVIAICCWIFTSIILSLYDPKRIYRWVDEMHTAIYSLLLSFMFFAGVLYFSLNVSRPVVIFYLIIQGLFLLSWRVASRIYFRFKLRHSKRHVRRTVIIGVGGLADAVAQTLKHYEWSGFELVGYITPDKTDTSSSQILGHIKDVKQIISDNQVNNIIIALPSKYYDSLKPMLSNLESLSLQIYIIPDIAKLARYKPSIESFGQLPLINLSEPAMNNLQRLTKRLFDIVITSILIILTLPMMVFIYFAVKLTSAGPAIFKQERIGENGRIFVMYKFRSMVINAEKIQADENHNKLLREIDHKKEDDPRITKIGNIIRRTSLDELPQLFNVLKGDMSLVGPRPEMPWIADKYEPWQYERFAVPPGITGWWQVTGRSTKPMHLSTEDDLYYIHNYSLLLDINILWRTLSVVTKGKGAY